MEIKQMANRIHDKEINKYETVGNRRINSVRVCVCMCMYVDV